MLRMERSRKSTQENVLCDPGLNAKSSNHKFKIVESLSPSDSWYSCLCLYSNSDLVPLFAPRFVAFSRASCCCLLETLSVWKSPSNPAAEGGKADILCRLETRYNWQIAEEIETVLSFATRGGGLSHAAARPQCQPPTVAQPLVSGYCAA